MKKYLKNFGVSNISKYYLLGFLLTALFPVSNWVFFFSEYMDIKTIGIIDGVAILIGILSEIPTGALGDMLGKRKTLMIGYGFTAAASIIIAAASTVTQFLVGNTLFFIGFSFISGSQEAMAYDSLLEKGKEEMFTKVSSVYGTISIVSLLLSMGIGGLAFRVSPRLPWVLTGIYMFIAFFISSSIKEPKMDSEHFSLKKYFKQLSSGLKTLLSLKLRKLILPILLLTGVIELGQGLVRQSTGAYFGYDGETFGYLLAGSTFVATLLVIKLEAITKKLGEYAFLLVLTAQVIMAYTIGYFTNNIYAGAIVVMMLVISGWVSKPLISIAINHKIESKNRATTISTLALLKQIPYIVLVLFFAQLADVENLKTLFLGIIVVLTVLSLIGVVVSRSVGIKDHKQIST